MEESGMRFQITVEMALTADVPASQLLDAVTEDRAGRQMKMQLKKVLKEQVRKQGFKVRECDVFVMLPGDRG